MQSGLEPLVAVLAGGRGSRIGGPKATVQLGGRPMIDWPLEAIAAAGLETVVVAKPETALPDLAVELWTEPSEPFHPLLGIVTALEHAGDRPVIVCACDLPFVKPQVISQLAAFDDRLVVTEAGDAIQPLLARYEMSLLQDLRAALVAEQSMHAAVERLEPRTLEVPEHVLFNVNTDADLAAAEAMLPS